MFVTRFILGLEEGFENVRRIREAVCVEDEGISPDEEFDALDAYAAHVYVAGEDGSPIATGRMYPDGDALLIDRVAVMPACRREPYGDLVVRLLLYRAQQLPQRRINALLSEEEARLFLPFGFRRTIETREARGAVRSVYSVESSGVAWHSACKDGG